MDQDKNPSTNKLEHFNDEMIVSSAWDFLAYAHANLKELKEIYPALPAELIPHREYFLRMIEMNTKFLVDTNNWYRNEQANQDL
jgi:hypothetical protein